MRKRPLVGAPGELELLRKRCQAVRTKRKRQGQWSGGINTHSDYQALPLDWMERYLHIPKETMQWSLNQGYDQHNWDGDPDPLYQAMQSIANWQDCGIESATGIGKSFMAAALTLWFIACFEDSIVVTVAPKEEQLLKFIWKEIGDLWSRFENHFPEAELLPGSGVLRMKPKEAEREKWAAFAFVCGVGADEKVATKAQGFHAEHMLIITEETTGIHPAIMKALFNTRTDDHNLHLALGNPDHQQDELHRFCVRESVKAIRGSALDHPNIITGERVVPGTIGPRRLAERTRDLGLGSRLYNSRVRGISPAEAEDALIKRAWCEAAAKRWDDPDFRKGSLALGVDVADSPDGDSAAIARWQGACLTEVHGFKVVDASEVGERVVLEARNKENPIDPRFIGIDSVGVGASAVNTMRRLGLRVRHISGGRRAVPGLDVDSLWSVTEADLEGNLRPAGPRVVEAEQFDNLRSQVWWRMREDLRLGRVALPDDSDLFDDLCTPAYRTKALYICVEPKESIKDRLRRSPDKGDAACYGNFVRRRIPVKEPEDEKPQVRPENVDRGLERRLAQLERQQLAEKKRLMRFLKSRRQRVS
jgi:hypothetical protein